MAKKHETNEKDDEELEEIINGIIEGDDESSFNFSEVVIPSLERTRIVETSLERGLRGVEIKEDEWHSKYGVQEDYVAGKNYESAGNDYEGYNEVNVDAGRNVSLSIGNDFQRNDNIMQGKGYPGSKQEGSKYHSKLEENSKEKEEKRKRERRMW